MLPAWLFGVPCDRCKILLIEMMKAYLNVEVLEHEKAFVLLPSVAGGSVVHLKWWPLGIHLAAMASEEQEAGFLRSISVATVFLQPMWESLVVFRDGFTALGQERHLREF